MELFFEVKVYVVSPKLVGTMRRFPEITRAVKRNPDQFRGIYRVRIHLGGGELTLLPTFANSWTAYLETLAKLKDKFPFPEFIVIGEKLKSIEHERNFLERV